MSGMEILCVHIKVLKIHQFDYFPDSIVEGGGEVDSVHTIFTYAVLFLCKHRHFSQNFALHGI